MAGSTAYIPWDARQRRRSGAAIPRGIRTVCEKSITPPERNPSDRTIASKPTSMQAPSSSRAMHSPFMKARTSRERSTSKGTGETKLDPRSPLHPGCLIATGSVARHVRLKRRRLVSRAGHGGSGALVGLAGQGVIALPRREAGVGGEDGAEQVGAGRVEALDARRVLAYLRLRIELRLVGSTIHPTGVGAVLVKKVRGEKRRGAAKRGPKSVVEVGAEPIGVAGTGIEKRGPAKAVRRVNLLGGGPGEAARVPPVA